MRLRDIGEARIALSAVQAGEGSCAGFWRRPPCVRHVVRARPSRRARQCSALSRLRPSPRTPPGRRSRPSSIPVRRFALPAAMAPAAEFAISPDGSRIAYISTGPSLRPHAGHGRDRRSRHRARATDGLLWSPDGRRLAYVGDSELRIMPAEGGPPFTVCRIPGSGRLTKSWWHDDGTIYFAVWRESLYRVLASGGAPTRVAAIAPEKEIDFHSVAVLPDGRLIVTTHLRGEDAARLDLVDGDSARRSPTISTSTSSGSARPTSCCSCACARIPACGSCRSTAAGLISTRATLLEAGARDFSVSGEGTLVSSVPARERRELVWVEHGSTSARPTRRRRRDRLRRCAVRRSNPRRAGVARALARRPARGVWHSRRQRRRGIRRARIGDGPRHTRACRRRPRRACRPAGGSRGHRPAGCCTRPVASRRCRSTTGPRMDRRAAGRSWRAWPPR